MPSLRSINKEAGTNFRRWKEVTTARGQGGQYDRAQPRSQADANAESPSEV